MKRLSRVSSLLCLSYLFVYILGQPTFVKALDKGAAALDRNGFADNKCEFVHTGLRVEVVSLNKYNANIVVTAKYKNLRNNPFILGANKEDMYLLGEDGERWIYDNDDYGFTFLKPRYEFMPSTWHKITFQFNKPEGSTKSTSFTFVNKVQVAGSFEMINILIKNIPDGYGS